MSLQTDSAELKAEKYSIYLKALTEDELSVEFTQMEESVAHLEWWLFMHQDAAPDEKAKYVVALHGYKGALGLIEDEFLSRGL